MELTLKGNALKQIKDRKCHQKYSGKETYFIGIEFSKEDRNIVSFEWEQILPEDKEK